MFRDWEEISKYKGPGAAMCFMFEKQPGVQCGWTQWVRKRVKDDEVGEAGEVGRAHSIWDFVEHKDLGFLFQL